MSAPTISSIDISNGHLIVTSTIIPDISGYYIFIDGVQYFNTDTTPYLYTLGTVLSLDLSNGTQHSITIQAVYTSGVISGESTPASVYIPAPPTRPTITVLTASGNTIIVSYTDTDAQIDYSNNAVTPYYSLNGLPMNTSNSPINASGGTFTISDLSYGITYTITLQNRNVTGQSAFSVSGSVYTPALPTKPTITSLTQSGNTVIVAYTDNDLPIDYNTYAITPYYSIDDGAYTSSNTQINAATSPINASGGIFIISDLLYGSTYNIQVQNRNVFGSGLPSDTSSITMSQPEYSNICFLAGTPITVDQGIIAIDKIDTTIHTIRGKPIIGISKTISNGDYLMCFEKNALGPNVPTTRTIMSPLHKIMYNNNWVIAKDLFGKSRYKIKTVSYNEECLYNVIMETHETMLVNNMIVETLHPDNPNSKIFTVCN